jgi:hypothetical protein
MRDWLQASSGGGLGEPRAMSTEELMQTLLPGPCPWSQGGREIDPALVPLPAVPEDPHHCLPLESEGASPPPATPPPPMTTTSTLTGARPLAVWQLFDGEWHRLDPERGTWLRVAGGPMTSHPPPGPPAALSPPTPHFAPSSYSSPVTMTITAPHTNRLTPLGQQAVWTPAATGTRLRVMTRR